MTYEFFYLTPQYILTYHDLNSHFCIMSVILKKKGMRY